MGRPWGIVTTSERGSAAEAERWRPLLARTRCPQLRIPIHGAAECVVLSAEPDQRIAALDVEAEIALLETPDLTWDDVGALLGDQMVFLPITGIAPVLYTGTGFEPKTLVGGLDRLLGLSSRSALEVQLRAAATLAAYHRLAIEVRP